MSKTEDRNQSNDDKSARRQPVSRRRRWLFRLVAICIPLSPLFIGEIICRFKGYGGHIAIFPHITDIDGKALYGTNQAGIASYFHTNLSIAGKMREQLFTLPKDSNEVRILLLGGSAAEGFPEPRSRSSAAFLQAMLSDVWPDRTVEVHNLGVTAIASFPVMYILAEALAFDPDLVIVYSGNNEYYGAHGVASIHSFGRSTTAMRLYRAARGFALVQWYLDRSSARQRATQEESESAGQTLMERVVAESQIGPDDPRRDAARDNLRRHITWMVHACGRRGVPVIVCTLPANERDLAPIGTDVAPPVSDDRQAAFQRLLDEGGMLLASDPAAALAKLEEAEAVFAEHALLHYRKGQALAVLGRDEEAARSFAEAKDWDAMPWRAPDVMNDVVRDVATAEANATLCDLLEAFRAASPAGSIGWELMDDHVHPSLQGQALIAKTILQSMAALEGQLHVSPEQVAELPGWEAYAARLGDNKYDHYAVARSILRLLDAPFFVRSNPAARARFEAIRNELESGMSPAVLAAVERWEAPEMHVGGHYPITGAVGSALLSEGMLTDADRMFLIARENVADYSLWRMEFTWDALVCRRQLRDTPNADDVALIHEMIRCGEMMLKLGGGDHPPLHKYLGLVYSLVGQHSKAVEHLAIAVKYVKTVDDFDVVEALTRSLVATGQLDRARHMLQLDISDPNLRAACRNLLAQLDAQSG